jgi:hypothetical protein
LYDVTADGQRFVMVAPPRAAEFGSSAINIVSNWQGGLKK